MWTFRSASSRLIDIAVYQPLKNSDSPVGSPGYLLYTQSAFASNEGHDYTCMRRRPFDKNTYPCITQPVPTPGTGDLSHKGCRERVCMLGTQI